MPKQTKTYKITKERKRMILWRLREKDRVQSGKKGSESKGNRKGREKSKKKVDVQ